MGNFLKFIEEDVNAKKVLISTMPTKTKTNIRKYNEKIDDMLGKYNEYKASVKKYIETKSKSFNIKRKSNALDELSDKVNMLEHVKFVLNPTNTYFEKVGFDNLLYQISNYSDFNFSSLNEIIDQILDKFELAGIHLSSNDFNYTYYVNEYMTSFIEARKENPKNLEKVSEIFEKIYWVNPEIIEHIELNFRKLIKRHEKDFVDYVGKLQEKVKIDNKITDYQDCLERLEKAYTELNVANRENICDIIDLAKNGEIDINNYFEDSKVRTSTYNSLMIDSSIFKEKENMEKFYDCLEKLKANIEEYSNYIKFVPFFDNFKNEYEKLIPKGDNANNDNKELKNIESKIADKEAKLEKLHKKIQNEDVGLFNLKNKENALKQMKMDSIKLAKELYDLYKSFDEEYFKDKVLSILNNSLTISDVLHLYYSFDYFKKMAIKKAFDLTAYDEILKYSESFDLFAMDPTNIIINGVPLFEENNIAKVIVNKYRFDNIDLSEEDLEPENLESLLGKVQFLLRINEIEKSKTSVDKIWFMVQVENIIKAENKKE